MSSAIFRGSVRRLMSAPVLALMGLAADFAVQSELAPLGARADDGYIP